MDQSILRRLTSRRLQLDGFALDILHNRPVMVPGEMGRRDVDHPGHLRSYANRQTG